jgi:hypothetical protein
MQKLRIYVASSWRNQLQPNIVTKLRDWGHDVYDFRNPPGRTGFGWKQTDPEWQDGAHPTPQAYRKMLEHPIAIAGHKSDLDALNWCDVCVYVRPCGCSASWELGYAMGKGKPCFVVQYEPAEPELMFRGATIIATPAEFREVFEGR